jgi:hypothetical protein
MSKRTANDGLDLISNRFLVLTRESAVSTNPHIRLHSTSYSGIHEISLVFVCLEKVPNTSAEFVYDGAFACRREARMGLGLGLKVSKQRRLVSPRPLSQTSWPHLPLGVGKVKGKVRHGAFDTDSSADPERRLDTSPTGHFQPRL